MGGKEGPGPHFAVVIVLGETVEVVTEAMTVTLESIE